MTTTLIHPEWAVVLKGITKGYSLEVTARDIPDLVRTAPGICSTTPVLLPYLPGENNNARVASARIVRDLGFEPMPHFVARRITSLIEFEDFLTRAVSDAGIKRGLVVAGDASSPAGPFADSASLIATGVFERVGIKEIGVAGHPEGHPIMSEEHCWSVLESKCRSIEGRGMTPLIVTQFVFDADVILGWLETLRERGLDHSVRIGVPGPAVQSALVPRRDTATMMQDFLQHSLEQA